VRYRKEIQPDLVITPSTFDTHQDHEVIAKESLRAFKNYCSVIGYEMPWNMLTNQLNLFVKLEERHIKKKWELLENYHSQIEGKKRDYFSKEFIFGLAKVRGVQCNSEYAEAFEVIRWIR
jgi:LmbE family N-acetylglucosaminyl deacetylase